MYRKVIGSILTIKNILDGIMAQFIGSGAVRIPLRRLGAVFQLWAISKTTEADGRNNVIPTNQVESNITMPNSGWEYISKYVGAGVDQ